MKKSDCAGCYHNFYNTTTKECWSFNPKNKKIKRMLIHKDEMPPYKHKVKLYPECYTEQHSVLVDSDNLTDEGYWK